MRKATLAVTAAGLGMLTLAVPAADARYANVDPSHPSNARIDGPHAAARAGDVQSAGDINGDGYDDLIVAARGDPLNGVQGSTYVVLGRAGAAHLDLGNRDASVVRIHRNGFDSWRPVDGAGDVNGDGLADLVIGDRFDSAGQAWVVYGTEQPGDIDLSSLGTRGFRIAGEHAGDALGARVAGGGDVNGDGLDDVLVAAITASRAGRTRAGAAYVVFGSRTRSDVALNASGTAAFEIVGEYPTGRLGSAVSAAGDVNGDGFDDVILGAPEAGEGWEWNASHGVAYVVYGGPAPQDLDLASLATRGFRVRGGCCAQPTRNAGESVDGAGDVNGDGLGDVLIGASWSAEGGESGAAYIVYGQSLSADVNLAQSLSGRGFRLWGDGRTDQTGHAVSGGGDFDGDGLADVLVGAPFNDAATDDNAGSAWAVGATVRDDLFDHSPDATYLSWTEAEHGFRIRGAAAGDRLGHDVTGLDFDGDGSPDVAVGAPYADPRDREDAGSAYVVFGPPNHQPAARFSASPDPPSVGDDVTFDASGTGDDGQIVRHEWDLDGDGDYETDTGGDPRAGWSYDSSGDRRVALRVTDDRGATAGWTYVVHVQPRSASPPPGNGSEDGSGDRVAEDELSVIDVATGAEGAPAAASPTAETGTPPGAGDRLTLRWPRRPVKDGARIKLRGTAPPGARVRIRYRVRRAGAPWRLVTVRADEHGWFRSAPIRLRTPLVVEITCGGQRVRALIRARRGAAVLERADRERRGF